MIDVTLTDYEMAMASDAGRLRNIAAVKRGYESRISGREWQAHIEGACGEVAVAKATGKYWGGSINSFKSGGDLDSTGWEVRTRSDHNYDLIVRDNDPDDRVFILVTGLSPNFKIWGWIMSQDAKREEWRANYGGHGTAYFVPKLELNEMGELYEHQSNNVGI